MDKDIFTFGIIIFVSIITVVKSYEWNKKRKIQEFMNNFENDELKRLALATNTIGWVAGNKFGTDGEKYYYYALNSLSEHKNLLSHFPAYSGNLREHSFEVYKILKEEMESKYSEQEREFSQIWAAMQILDVKNYINNNQTPKDVDKSS